MPIIILNLAVKCINCFSSCPPEQEFLEIRTTGSKYYSPWQKINQALPLRGGVRDQSWGGWGRENLWVRDVQRKVHRKERERARDLQKGLFKLECAWMKLCKRPAKEPLGSSRTNNSQNSLWARTDLHFHQQGWRAFLQPRPLSRVLRMSLPYFKGCSGPTRTKLKSNPSEDHIDSHRMVSWKKAQWSKMIQQNPASNSVKSTVFSIQ